MQFFFFLVIFTRHDSEIFPEASVIYIVMVSKGLSKKLTTNLKKFLPLQSL